MHVLGLRDLACRGSALPGLEGLWEGCLGTLGSQ